MVGFYHGWRISKVLILSVNISRIRERSSTPFETVLQVISDKAGVILSNAMKCRHISDLDIHTILRSNRLVITIFIILSINVVTFTIAIEMFNRSLSLNAAPSYTIWHYPDEGWRKFRLLRMSNRYINTFVNLTFGEILECIGTGEGSDYFLQQVWSITQIFRFQFLTEIH